jgi:two-component system, cell cycle sensor histidine kinase and response regulator CckA
MLDALLEHAPFGVALLDAQLRFVRGNAALARDELRGEVDALLRRALAGEAVTEVPLRRDGREWVTSFFPVVDEDGTITGVGLTMLDVTEVNAAERAVRQSEWNLRQMAAHLPLVFWMTSADAGEILYVSPGYEHVWGRSVESLVAEPGSFLDAVHPDDRARIAAASSAAPEVDYNEEYRVVRPDGTTVWVRDRAFAVRDADGRKVARTGFAMDVTESKELEAQLRQAVKMEGLGRLAGGIAHDFNNMLTLIEGYGALALAKLAGGDDATGEVREMLEAGERAADLTRRLLTFSRRRPQVQGHAVVNEVVGEMERLLRRLIGEDVRVSTALDPEAGAVAVAAGELGQVVMNLAVNARDAMPGGGVLAIETGRARIAPGDVEARAGAQPGEHAVLVVRDTGIGMSAHVVEHAFDPFFTTKPPGTGTGLGLATVYGIVEQAGGHVGLRSEPGAGTVVTVHLPLVPGPEPAWEREPVPPRAVPRRPGATVLVVEDEPALRALVALVLREHGYAVLEAGSGDEAMRVAARHDAPLDLLLTDVVMPGMAGPELAAELRRRRPGLPTIFMSGYPDRLEGGVGSLDHGVFVPKPFSPEALARRVGDVLDQSPGDPV